MNAIEAAAKLKSIQGALEFVAGTIVVLLSDGDGDADARKTVEVGLIIKRRDAGRDDSHRPLFGWHGQGGVYNKRVHTALLKIVRDRQAELTTERDRIQAALQAVSVEDSP